MLLPAPLSCRVSSSLKPPRVPLIVTGSFALNLKAGDHKTTLSFVVDDTLKQTCQCRCSFAVSMFGGKMNWAVRPEKMRGSVVRLEYNRAYESSEVGPDASLLLLNQQED